MQILIVDDHPFMRLGVRAAVRPIVPTAAFAEASSGDEALVVCEALQPRLVISDVAMPGLVDGVELTRRLGKRHPTTIVLVFTAHEDARTLRAALHAGAAGRVAKSATAAQLGTAVSTLLAGGTFLCPSCAEVVRLASRRESCVPEKPGVDVLSAREREVLTLISGGETTHAIASSLGISPRTVETHRLNIMHRLRVDNVVSLTRFAIKHGLSRV